MFYCSKVLYALINGKISLNSRATCNCSNFFVISEKTFIGAVHKIEKFAKNWSHSHFVFMGWINWILGGRGQKVRHNWWRHLWMTRQEMDCFFWAWATIQMLQDCAEWLEWEKIKFTQEKLCLRVNSIMEFENIIQKLFNI